MITDMARWGVLAAILALGFAGCALVVQDTCAIPYYPRRTGMLMVLGATGAGVVYAAVSSFVH